MNEKLRKEIIVYIRNVSEIAENKTRIEELQQELRTLNGDQKELETNIINHIEASKDLGMTAFSGPVSFYCYGQAYLFSIQRASGRQPKKLIIQEIENLI